MTQGAVVPYILPLSLLFSAVQATAPAVVAPIFPAHQRCRGVGLVYTVSGGGLVVYQW